MMYKVLSQPQELHGTEADYFPCCIFFQQFWQMLIRSYSLTQVENNGGKSCFDPIHLGAQDFLGPDHL